MDTRNGKIRIFDDASQRDNFVKDKRKKGEPWWIECKLEPTQAQITKGVKGHHPCLCGSGKKFRDCCRRLFIFKHGQWVRNPQT